MIIYAVSGYPDDIQAAINQALALNEPSTIILPNGTFIYDPNSQISPRIPTTAPSDLDLLIAGSGNTLIKWDSDPTGGQVFLAVEGGGFIKIANLTYNGMVTLESTSSTGIYIAPQVTGTHLNFRIYNVNMLDFASAAIAVNNSIGEYNTTVSGLIDNCFFDNPFKDIVPWYSYSGYGLNLQGGVKSQSWWGEPSDFLGMFRLDYPTFIYVEDCVFAKHRHGVASNTGAWYVIRHCITRYPRPHNYRMIDVHGLANYKYPGGRGAEVYNNQIIGNTAYPHGDGVNFRGGDGVIWGNTFLNNRNSIILENESLMADPSPVFNFAVKDVWIWSNIVTGGWETLLKVQQIEVSPGVFVPVYNEGAEYHLSMRPGYVPYIYPHPWRAQNTHSLTVTANLDSVPFTITKL